VSTFEPCPFCQHDLSKPVRFTPWGGVVGPRIFSLVKCTGCGGQFNGKSGRRVDRGIRIYTLATMIVLAVVAAWAIYSYVGPRPAGSEAGKGMPPSRMMAS
jgi:hypothetical protein